MTLDPTRLYLPDNPPEWAAIPPELMARLRPKNGLHLPWQKRLLDKIAMSRWFLVKNDLGERCGSCRTESMPGEVHTYITINCIESPFHGVNDLLLVINQWDEQRRERLISGMRPGTIVPITLADAKKYIGKIRQRGTNLYPTLDL